MVDHLSHSVSVEVHRGGAMAAAVAAAMIAEGPHPGEGAVGEDIPVHTQGAGADPGIVTAKVGVEAGAGMQEAEVDLL